MQTCIFEDEKYLNFEPLIYSRPVYELICGISTIREKAKRLLPNKKLSLHCRKYLETIVKAENPGASVNDFSDDEILLVNGRVTETEKLDSIFHANSSGDIIYKSANGIVAARISGANLQRFKSNFSDVIETKLFDGIPAKEIDIKLADYLWDFIYLNGIEIRKDFEFLSQQNKKERLDLTKHNFTNVSFVSPEQIFINKSAELKPGVVLDASSGPIYIDKNASIFPNAVIQGPVYIGESSKIKSSATIYPNVSINRVCKVGGEVEDSIILPFTNKQHPGFLGHSYMGSWINIGADTNCSDLQNNYGTIKVQVNGKHIDSGKQFVGLMMGDHSKTAINTMFNTGTVVGFSCNIYGAGFPPKYIPSFAWGGSELMREYKFSKAIETASAVFNRRNKKFSAQDENLFKEIFELTKEDRMKRGF
jgi:UDP-N-acetylglucosamine diphosphorylase/glucosamine-1-phosphate N-acetyltransferase